MERPVSTTYCPHCGLANALGGAYCEGCGRVNVAASLGTPGRVKAVHRDLLMTMALAIEDALIGRAGVDEVAGQWTEFTSRIHSRAIRRRRIIVILLCAFIALLLLPAFCAIVRDTSR